MELQKINNTETELSAKRKSLDLDFSKEQLNKLGFNLSKSSLETYKRSINIFYNWCYENNKINPKDSILEYISYLVDIKKRKYNTVKLFIAALNYSFNETEISYSKKQMKDILKRIENKMRSEQKEIKQANPIDLKQIRNIYGNLSLRDKVIVSLSFFGAFRVSELINIKIKDILFDNETGDALILIHKSKTQKAGEITTKPIAKLNSILCPVTAIKNYMEAYNITEGYLIRGFNKYRQITNNPIQRNAVSCMLKRNELSQFSTHSFRRGFITESIKNGSTINDIMNVSGHKTPAMIIHYAKQVVSVENSANNDWKKKFNNI